MFYIFGQCYAVSDNGPLSLSGEAQCVFIYYYTIYSFFLFLSLHNVANQPIVMQQLVLRTQLLYLFQLIHLIVIFWSFRC